MNDMTDEQRRAARYVERYGLDTSIPGVEADLVRMQYEAVEDAMQTLFNAAMANNSMAIDLIRSGQKFHQPVTTLQLIEAHLELAKNPPPAEDPIVFEEPEEEVDDEGSGTE